MKIKNLKLKITASAFCALLFALCSMLCAPSIARAQGLSLGVFPPIIEVEATPPAQLKVPVTIQNSGDSTVDLDVLLKPFTQNKDNNGQVEYLTPNQLNYSDPLIFQRIKMTDGANQITSLTLAPQQQKTISLSINIPNNEPPGDYYFSILFISKGSLVDQQNATSVSGGIATNVLLTVGPKGDAYGALQEFSAPVFVTGGPVPFTISVLNLSRFFITPVGQILITNMYNQIIGKVNLLPVNILSNTTRYIPDTTQSSLTQAIWPEKVLFGWYSAHVTLALTPNGPILHKTIYFFALPWQFLIGFILVIILGVSVGLRIRQKLQV